MGCFSCVVHVDREVLDHRVGEQRLGHLVHLGEHVLSNPVIEDVVAVYEDIQA